MHAEKNKNDWEEDVFCSHWGFNPELYANLLDIRTNHGQVCSEVSSMVCSLMFVFSVRISSTEYVCHTLQSGICKTFHSQPVY